MIPDERDTIVAAACAPGGAARSVVRISGPETPTLVGRLTGGPLDTRPVGRGARRLPGLTVRVLLAGRCCLAPCDLFFWPGRQSYTKQPSAELHTVGSPPVAAAVVAAACEAGARLAAPGEFTLRAFLAGRIDLVQAEAVLGVIEAAGGEALERALDQLAGGLSQPLGRLREDLVQLLAEIEAGLDFVDEEDVRFIERRELVERIRSSRRAVGLLIDQTTERGRHDRPPRVALTGPPNAGKSSLFNAIVARWGAGRPAIVSPVAGTTRDTLSAEVEFEGFRIQLIDTAGRVDGELSGPEAAADRHAQRDAAAADLRLACHAADSPPPENRPDPGPVLKVLTKSDLLGSAQAPSGHILTSSRSDEGLVELLSRTSESLQRDAEHASGGGPLAISERCRASLAAAHRCLGNALRVAGAGEQELVAFELRQTLDDLGQVVGLVVTDDLLDRIFSDFCIGK